ncbi:hypothetical protein BAT02nite_19940 [Bacillus atrophaeus]|nr:hypothetical protein BAT02nite_19940 [Bacillus atrophaeus]
MHMLLLIRDDGTLNVYACTIVNVTSQCPKVIENPEQIAYCLYFSALSYNI